MDDLVNHPRRDLELVEDQVFERVNFCITGKRLVNCSLRDCNIVIAGPPVHLVGNQFIRCQYHAVGVLLEAKLGKAPGDLAHGLLKFFKDLEDVLFAESGVDQRGNIILG